ncbi:MAG: hypothetical protein IIB88_03725, partial [Chloroflexi bacterium]|nr:hypothetical protein [Chloroflexota bacterium]
KWAAKALFLDNPREPTGEHWRRGRGKDYTWAAAEGKIEIGANCVCGNCNHGWMNEIETAARPVISEMIRGNHIVIDAVESEAIGKWLCLKTIIERYTQPSPIPVPQEIREYFYSTREPPRSWHAWIAYYRGTRPVHYHSGNLSTDYTPPLAPFPQSYTGLTFTLAIGYFAAKVFGIGEMMSFRTHAVMLDVWPPPRLRPKLSQRGQSERRAWPPGPWLNDQRLDAWSKSLPEFAD